MISKELNTFQNNIRSLVNERRLSEAFISLRSKIGGLMKSRADRAAYSSLLAKLDTLDTHYTYLLDFLANGVADPEREKVYRTIITGVLSVLDQLVVLERTVDESSLYCSMRRTLAMRPGKGIPELVKRLSDIVDNEEFLEKRTFRQNLESLQSELFTNIWATYPLSKNDAAIISQAISKPDLDNATVSLIVSASMLSLLEQFDENKLIILLDAYELHPAPEINAAAIIGILIAMWRLGNYPLSTKILARIENLTDSPRWHSDLKAAYLELIRARDTERITRKMREEILPRMMDMRPDILNKINDGSIDPADIEGLQENPEWQDLLDKSGLSDRLKELTEIQLEGGDVLMSTFAGLKQFPFFATLSNWFVPFDPEHSAVTDIIKSAGIFASLMSATPLMCDSDKYSSMFAIRVMPDAQRELMANQLRGQEENISDAIKHIAGDSDAERFHRLLNLYTQNLNRFFKLSPHHNDFVDPFASTINLLNVPVLSTDFDDSDLVAVVAEFYFKLGYYADAFDMFSRLDSISDPDAARYQKMGYCMEKTGQISAAVDFYRRAEILDAESIWTLRRLASVLRASGNADAALEAYRRLAEKQPEDSRTALMLGYCLMEKGLYKEAISQFYKVDFLDEKSHKAWRPLAWTHFLNRDFDRAEEYYQKIIAHSPRSNDYLNMGHVALAKGNLREAINAYRLAVDSSENHDLDLRQALADDAPALASAGIDPLLPSLVADAVYRIKRP